MQKLEFRAAAVLVVHDGHGSSLRSREIACGVCVRVHLLAARARMRMPLLLVHTQDFDEEPFSRCIYAMAVVRPRVHGRRSCH